MVIYSIPPLTKELFLRGKKKKKKVVLTVMQWVNDHLVSVALLVQSLAWSSGLRIP